MSFLIELRRATRALLNQPGLSLLAVVALGLGIGLPTAMYGFLDAAVLRGLPVPEPDEIVVVERMPIDQSGDGWGAAARDYLAWRDQQQSLEELAGVTTGTVTVRGDAAVDRWSAAWVTPTLFRTLGVSALHGRTFAADGRSGEAEALLGYAAWRDRFGGDPGVVGRTVHVDGSPHTVVGVMPADFRFPTDQDVWIPLTVDQAAAVDPSFPTMSVVGRLRDDATIEDARAEFALIARGLAERYPETNAGLGAAVTPLTERFLGTTPTRQMYVILGAVLLVLLIACTNVANLLLVRAVHRSRDLAIQSALGASRSRVVAQVLSESSVLAAAGGALALAIAAAATRALGAMLGDRMPYWFVPRVDGSVLLFALLLVGVAALAGGALPALRATRRNLSSILRDAARGATGVRAGRVMRGLIVFQIALSLGLLVTTGLLVQSVRAVRSVDLDFASTDVFTARITLPEGYDGSERLRFYDDLDRAVTGAPEVTTTALATALPATRGPTARLAVEGVEYPSSDAMPIVRNVAVSPDFFRVFGVAPTRGRAFAGSDREGAEPVAVVNERLAAELFEGDPIGRRVRVGTGEDARWRRIVGVVPDLWMAGLDASGVRNPAGVYVPLAQTAPASVSIAARTRAGSPLAVTGAVRRAAFGLDPDTPIYDVRTMPQVIEDNSWFYGLSAAIVGACGLAALLLATIGLYGVIAFSLEQRRRELGIRMVMGARPTDVVRLVLSRGVVQLAVGLALGFGLAALLASGIGGLLFEVDPRDPLVFGLIGALLATVGIAAMLVPTLRAARSDPLDALRES